MRLGNTACVCSSWVRRGRARAPRRSSSPSTSRSRRSRPATSSAPTSPRAPRSGWRPSGYMDAGEYVPDEVTNLMVRNRIDEPDAVSGFLLDGYPRTLAQVEELDGMIKFTGHRLDAVVVLTVDRDEIVSAPDPAAPRSRAGPTTPRTSSGAARRSTPSRPSRSSASTATGASSSRSTAWVRSRRSPSASSTPSTSSRRAEPRTAMGWRDRGIEIKTPEQVASMRRAGLVVGRTLERAARPRCARG